MKLETYKKLHGLTDKEVAGIAGVDPSMIRKIRCGERRPSPSVAAKISAATGGQVTVEDLLYPEGLPAGAKMSDDRYSVRVDPTTTKYGAEPHVHCG